MKKFKYEFEVDDSFECGYCIKCPLYVEEEEYGVDFSYCVLFKNEENCPLKDVEKHWK